MGELFKRYLTPEELETIQLEYEKLRLIPNLSIVERTKPISDAYMEVLRRMKKALQQINN